jgi:hypothetical protein
MSHLCPATIDGLIDEMSTGIKIAPGDWNSDLKKVT